MYKRILVPVDGSRTSMLGLREAIHIAQGSKAKLRLIYVVDEFLAVQDSAFTFSAGDLLRSLNEYGKKALATAKAVVEKRGVGVETVLLETTKGRVADGIVDEARKWRADLIVMGTHGRRGFSHLVLGSDAEMVIKLAPVPVLLVRGKEAAKASRRGKK